MVCTSQNFRDDSPRFVSHASRTKTQHAARARTLIHASRLASASLLVAGGPHACSGKTKPLEVEVQLRALYGLANNHSELRRRIIDKGREFLHQVFDASFLSADSVTRGGLSCGGS